MKLGEFSLSLSVSNLQKSKDFYQKLGFEVFHGDESQNWLIMRNAKTTIGLFQGMFEKNILTFNPGWDDQCNKLEVFDDVREIQKTLKSKDLSISKEIDENTSGPASFIIEDPDGNSIMFDQHV